MIFRLGLALELMAIMTSLTKMNPKEVGEQNNDQRESAEDYRED